MHPIGDNSSSSELLVLAVFVITPRLCDDSSDFSKLSELTDDSPWTPKVGTMVSTAAERLYEDAGADTLTLTKHSIVTTVKRVTKTFRSVKNIRTLG